MSNVNKNECVINGVQYKCRTCFDPGRTFFPLIDEAVNKKAWIDLLTNITHFQTNDDEKLPKTLCCKCTDKLKKSYEFILQIQDVNEKYSELLTKNEVSNQIDNAADCLEESAIALPLEPFVAEVKLEEDMVMSYEMEMETNDMQEDNEDNFDNEDRDDPFTGTFGEEKTTEPTEEEERALETTEENATKRTLRNSKAETENALRKQKKTTKKAKRPKVVKSEDDHDSDEVQKNDDSVENGPIVCENCPKTFATLYAHLKHQQKEHSLQEFNDDEKGKCPLCSKKFKNKFYVMDHVKNVHDKLKPFKCAHCIKTFATAGARKNHEITHTDQFPHKCEFCNRRFRLLGKLTCHLQIHTTKPELLCPVCKRGMKTQEELEAHIKNHEDNRLQCPSCGKLFTRRPNLNEHYNAVHLKLRPYKCQHCAQSFGDRKSRRVHERRHLKKDAPAVAIDEK